jgi:LysM repeat protein
VQSGDSLRRIADRFGVDIGTLKKRNGLKSARIYPGQELVIP